MITIARSSMEQGQSKREAIASMARGIEEEMRKGMTSGLSEDPASPEKEVYRRG
jgi:hypothetical protein